MFWLRSSSGLLDVLLLRPVTNPMYKEWLQILVLAILAGFEIPAILNKSTVMA
jgi:hypothetical protein